MTERVIDAAIKLGIFIIIVFVIVWALRSLGVHF